MFLIKYSTLKKVTLVIFFSFTKKILIVRKKGVVITTKRLCFLNFIKIKNNSNYKLKKNELFNL